MKKLIPLTIFTFFVSFSVVYGQEYTLISDIPGIADTTSVATLISGLINVVIAIGILLAVIMLSVGGLQYMTQDAISSKEEAKKTMTSAILGLLILLGSYLILYVINPDIIKKGSFLEGGGTPSSQSRSVGSQNDSTDSRDRRVVVDIATRNDEKVDEWIDEKCQPDTATKSDRECLRTNTEYDPRTGKEGETYCMLESKKVRVSCELK